MEVGADFYNHPSDAEPQPTTKIKNIGPLLLSPLLCPPRMLPPGYPPFHQPHGSVAAQRSGLFLLRLQVEAEAGRQSTAMAMQELRCCQLSRRGTALLGSSLTAGINETDHGLCSFILQNGEIADYVPPSPADKVRYTNPRPPSTKSVSSPNDDSKPFCSTCLKNQHLLTQALAGYLPPPTDPSYPAYEASYPEYRQKLEQRYPQVCPVCEEGVAKQIRQAEYMANTEYLRRKIEATRNGARRTLPQSWGWRRMLIFTGGVTWLTSLLLQGLWHIHAARVQQEPDDGLTGDTPDVTPKRFLRSCVLLKDDTDCLPLVTYLVRVSLLMAVGSIWWNSQLWKKTLGTWARLVGLDDYYRLQLVILLVRTAAWWALQHNTYKRLNREALRACHLFMLAFITLVSSMVIIFWGLLWCWLSQRRSSHIRGVMVKLISQQSTIVSLRIVKVSSEPRVSFRRNAERLVPRQEKMPRVAPAAPAPASVYPPLRPPRPPT